MVTGFDCFLEFSDGFVALLAGHAVVDEVAGSPAKVLLSLFSHLHDLVLVLKLHDLLFLLQYFVREFLVHLVILLEPRFSHIFPLALFQIYFGLQLCNLLLQVLILSHIGRPLMSRFCPLIVKITSKILIQFVKLLKTMLCFGELMLALLGSLLGLCPLIEKSGSLSPTDVALDVLVQLGERGRPFIVHLVLQLHDP